MQHSPRFVILVCVASLCAGAAGALELESERSDVRVEQRSQAPDLEAARLESIRFEMLQIPALALASGFDARAPLHPLRLEDPAPTRAPEGTRTAARWKSGDALPALSMLNRSSEAGLGTRPFSSQWFTSVRTESFPLVSLERLGLFGAQQKFRTLRGSISVGFEAGAAVRLRDHLNLTAGYRMLDYGLGEQGKLEGGKLDATLNAPFLGVAYNY